MRVTKKPTNKLIFQRVRMRLLNKNTVILHDEMGHPGWMNFHESLSQTNELLLPAHPGFGDSTYLEWVMTMRDFAGWYLEALDDLGLGQINMMGFF